MCHKFGTTILKIILKECLRLFFIIWRALTLCSSKSWALWCVNHALLTSQSLEQDPFFKSLCEFIISVRSNTGYRNARFCLFIKLKIWEERVWSWNTNPCFSDGEYTCISIHVGAATHIQHMLKNWKHVPYVIQQNNQSLDRTNT